MVGVVMRATRLHKTQNKHSTESLRIIEISKKVNGKTSALLWPYNDRKGRTSIEMNNINKTPRQKTVS